MASSAEWRRCRGTLASLARHKFARNGRGRCRAHQLIHHVLTMPTAATRSKGLRKFIPQPDDFTERYGRFTLTARDVEILDVVHRYRYLEARHIRALVGG